MKIKELINYGRRLLEENGVEDSSNVSKILAEYIFQMDRTQIVVNEKQEVEESEKTRYYLGLIEIIQGMPVQYITNKQEFMKLDFYVDENVLVPQPDTEILVEEVIEISNKEFNDDIEILDICTGSGCIGVSINKYIPDANITMSDISKVALDIAKINYEKNIPNDKAEFIQSDMFENITKKYDIIVSNPPYIESNVIENLPENVKKEPHIALDGGEDGLNFYRILILEASEHLNENGYLCMEIGYNQKESVINLLKESKKYEEIYHKTDLSGNDRVIIARKR